MVSQDPIADFLTRIRNAQHARKDHVSMPYSKTKMAIAELMVKHKFLKSAVKEEENGYLFLVIEIAASRDPLELRRMSKPGQRSYVKKDELRRVKSGLGISIISTSEGIMTGAEAFRKKLGGEFICTIS